MSTIQTDSAEPDTRRRRRTLAIVGGFVVGIMALYGLLLVVSGNGVPPGTTVLGVDIGGLSAAQATATLESELAEATAHPIEVSIAGEKSTVTPEVLGFSFDATATVDAARERTFNPITLLTRLVSTDEVEPVVSVDETALNAYLEQVGSQVDVPAKDGDVTFTETTAEAVEPVTGSGVDRAAAAAALRGAYLKSGGRVDLPIVEVAPRVGAEAVATALETFGKPAMAGPVVLTVSGTKAADPTVTLKPRDLGPALAMEPAPDGSLTPVVDVTKLRVIIDRRIGDGYREPRDATFRIVGGRPKVVPAVTGQTVNGEELSAALIAVLPRATERATTVGVERIQPAFTTADAKALGVTRVISTFTQHFPYAPYRVTNIGRAARYINGTLLKPGDTYSQNATIRERTVANGYTVGFVISGGQFAEELGGGVSTATTAMWHAAFYAGMQRVEQRAHSFYISRYLPGLEATVSWGNLDLKFRNDTKTGVFIASSITNDSITVTMYGTKHYNISAIYGPRTDARSFGTVYDTSEGCVPQDGVNGFRIVVTRVFKDLHGKVVRREPLTTTYRAASHVICGPKPKPKPSPSPTPKPSKSG